MKNKKTIITLIILTFFCYSESFSQEIKKHDYLEIIVVQKMNNSGKIKRIEVEDQKSLKGKSISQKTIESLKQTSDLLNYMNENNWEFLDRKAMVEGNNPIWISYLFRKQK